MDRSSLTAPGGLSRTDIWHIALILCVAGVSYANALGGGFVTDDFGLISDNPNVKDWSRLGDIFTTGYWSAEGWTGGLYRPLTIFSFLVEHTFAGLNPFVYHIDNVALHLLNSALVYLLLRGIFTGYREPLFAALLFAAHPVHVEAVAWVSGRAELLWAFFGLSSMLAFVRLPARPAGSALCAVLYTLAIFSKESAVVVPAYLLAYLLIFDSTETGGRKLGLIVRRLWPYAAVTAAFLAVKLIVLGSIGPGESEQALVLMGPYERFLIMSRALFEYIRLGFMPTGLCNDYLFPPPASLLDPRVLLAFAAVGLALALAPRLYRGSKTTLFALALFFVGLLPVSNIVPTGIIMSDRALYIPLLGICVLIASGLAAAGRLTVVRRANGLTLGAVFLVPVLGSFMVGSAARNPVWHDAGSLSSAYIERLKRNISLYPDYPPLYRLLARMEFRFRPYSPEAEKAIMDAGRLSDPNDPEMRDMMSYVYSERHMPGKALDEILAAINEVPGHAPYRFTAAKLLMELKRYPEALAMAGEAARLNPDEDDFFMLKGDILMEMGNDDAALAEYETAGRLNPENQDAFLMQGIILDSKGSFGPAIGMIDRAVRLRPDIPDLHYFLAVAYMDAGMREQAVGELDRALALNPGYRDAATLRARLLGPGLSAPR